MATHISLVLGLGLLDINAVPAKLFFHWPKALAAFKTIPAAATLTPMFLVPSQYL